MTEIDFYINLSNSVSAVFFVSGNEIRSDVLTRPNLLSVWKYLYCNMVYSLAYYYKDYLYNPPVEIDEMIEEVRDYLSGQNCSDIIYNNYYKGYGRLAMFNELLRLFKLLGKYIFNKAVEWESIIIKKDE